MKSIQQIITKFAAMLVSVFIAGHVTAQTSDKQDLDAAKQQFVQSSRRVGWNNLRYQTRPDRRSISQSVSGKWPAK